LEICSRRIGGDSVTHFVLLRAAPYSSNVQDAGSEEKDDDETQIGDKEI